MQRPLRRRPSPRCVAAIPHEILGVVCRVDVLQRGQHPQDLVGSGGNINARGTARLDRVAFGRSLSPYVTPTEALHWKSSRDTEARTMARRAVQRQAFMDAVCWPCTGYAQLSFSQHLYAPACSRSYEW